MRYMNKNHGSTSEGRRVHRARRSTPWTLPVSSAQPTSFPTRSQNTRNPTFQEVEPGSATARELTLGSSRDLGGIWAATILASKEVMRRKDMTRVTEPQPAWRRVGEGRSHRATWRRAHHHVLAAQPHADGVGLRPRRKPGWHWRHGTWGRLGAAFPKEWCPTAWDVGIGEDWGCVRLSHRFLKICCGKSAVEKQL
jgi:hypothetical protein